MKRVKWLDKECNSCGARLNSWDARISKTLAYKYPCSMRLMRRGLSGWMRSGLEEPERSFQRLFCRATHRMACY